ncbi:hypothetical protein ACLI4R_14520 [Natrialbaceae archaeon A-chndr2]
MSDEYPLREKDLAVLKKIQEGYDDVQKITAETTLENHEVNYCFTKLENLGLITIHKPEGYTERVVDGQKRVFKAPKRVDLTEDAELVFRDSDRKTEKCQEMEYEELVDRVLWLETQMARLQQSFRDLQEQIRENR